MAESPRNMVVQPADHPMVRAFILILILFSFITSTNIIHACNQTERSSLLSLALTLSSPPSLNWTSLNCCNWEGITCNKDGWVTHLSLPSKGLELKGGIFPSSSLANLTHLTHLNLSHNSLNGSVDHSRIFLSLTHLEILDLSYNLLFGELPHSLPSKNMIQAVDLSSNHFQGEFPSSFFQQAWNLTSFNVSNNTFSGSIPTSLCLHSSPLIRLLDFSFNKFNGSISHGLGECSKLQVFRAGYNNLSGLLPEDIYNATTLEEIALPANLLYGSLSNRIVNLTNLKILDLYFNHFSGVLPLHFGKLSKLKLMLLHFNNLEGLLPPSLMNCTNLVELRLATNSLEGDISMLNFSKLSQLGKLDLMENRFTGMIPMSLYSCKFLKALRLSSNNLEGQIQPEILSLKSLSFLSLSNNSLTNVTRAMKILMGSKSLTTLLLSRNFLGEEMAADNGVVDFEGLQNLRLLDLGGCELTGQIPLWLSKLKKLEILAMYNNRITGSIPSWLGTLPRLFSINMESNLLSGEFPKELCRLPMLVSGQTTTQVYHNYLELPIFVTPSDVAQDLQYNSLLYFPPTISIRNNSINGNIPTEIGQLQFLHVLDLSMNNFTGNIPDQISNLKDLETLDLSTNNLSGKIPSSLATLHFLAYLNVSYNNLAGPIPSSTQLQSLNASAFEGNPKLCGAPLPNVCQPINGIDVDDRNTQDVDKGHQGPWVYVSVAIGFIIGFFGISGPLMFKETRKYAYVQFLDNIQDRLCMIIIKHITG